MNQALKTATRKLIEELQVLDATIPLPARVRQLMQDVKALQDDKTGIPVFRTIYRSRSLITPEGEGLLLAQCRTNNADMGITGALLHHEGYFLQVLEGAEENVRALLTRIKRDPRHTDFVLLFAGTTPSRVFGEWSMGSATLDAVSFNSLVKACEDQDNKVTRLLVEFVKKGTWR